MANEQENEVEDSSGLPEWATMPEGLKVPPGRQVHALRFRSEWTDVPGKGDRHCIVWNLSDAEERIALKRSGGGDEPVSMATELAKQMIRAIDGHKADWSGVAGPGNIDVFWREIGSKCRQLVVRWYTQTHMLSDAERADFFENCVASRTAG